MPDEREQKGAQPQPKTRSQKPDDDGGLPLGLILIGLLAAYGVLFILFNSDQVNVSFVFFDAEISLVIALLITAGIGFLAGYGFRELRDRRRARRSSP
jgi:uncharacterized integral membrane protein